MVAARAERGHVRGTLVAGVEDPADPGGAGRVDRRPVQAYRVGGGVTGRHEQPLVGVSERTRQRVGVGVVAVAHLHTAVCEALCFQGVTRDYGNVAGRHPVQQVIDGRAVQGAGRPGHNNHGQPFVINGIQKTLHWKRGR